MERRVVLRPLKSPRRARNATRSAKSASTQILTGKLSDYFSLYNYILIEKKSLNQMSNKSFSFEKSFIGVSSQWLENITFDYIFPYFASCCVVLPYGQNILDERYNYLSCLVWDCLAIGSDIFVPFGSKTLATAGSEELESKSLLLSVVTRRREERPWRTPRPSLTNSSSPNPNQWNPAAGNPPTKSPPLNRLKCRRRRLQL